MLEGLELRGEDHEDEDERQAEGGGERFVLLVEGLHLSVVDDGIPRGERMPGDLRLELVRHLTERGAGAQLAEHGDLTLAVLVLDHAGAVLQRDLGDVCDLPGTAEREQVHAADAVRVLAVSRGEPNPDVRLVLAFPELGRDLAVDGQAELRGDLAGAEAQVGRAGAVHRDGQLGLGRIGLDLHVHRARDATQRLGDPLALLVEHLEVGPGDADHDGEVVAQALDGGRIADADPGRREIRKRRAGGVLQGEDPALARLLGNGEGAHLHLVGLAVQPDDGVDVLHLRHGAQELLRLRGALGGQVDRGGVRQL